METNLLKPAPLRGIRVRLAAFLSRKFLGKVISPIPMLYARNPALLSFSMKLESISARKLSLSQTDKLLIRLAVSLQNGCSFCGDMALAQAFQKKLGREKFSALVRGDSDRSLFAASEKALLRFIDERMQGFVSASTVEDLKAHFSERQIVDIGWSIAAECYYNTLALTFDIESDGLAAASMSGPNSPDKGELAATPGP